MPNEPSPPEAAEPRAMRMFVMSVLVRKIEADKTTNSGVVGWRVCELEATAKGLFLEVVQKEKPGFSIEEFTCMEIPESALRQALGWRM